MNLSQDIHLLKIGGPADLLLIPQSSADIPMLFALLYQYELPLHILGGGSNLLVSDQGVSGVVMKVSCGDVTWLGENRLFAGAGGLKASAVGFLHSHMAFQDWNFCMASRYGGRRYRNERRRLWRRIVPGGDAGNRL